MQFFVFFLCIIHMIHCQDVTESVTPQNMSTQNIDPSSTSPEPVVVTNTSCFQHNGNCKACVANAKCYYCETNQKCDVYLEHLIPNTCGIKNAHYLSCKVNFEYMMIGIGVMTGIALLIIVITCCCCCCKKKGIKISKDDLKWAAQREERKQIAAEKRKERTEKLDEMRRKYGLVKDSNPYERFDA